MTDLETSRTLSVRIALDPSAVYAFAVNPAHLPRWATGIGSSIDHIDHIDGQWVAQTEQGPVYLASTSRLRHTFGETCRRLGRFSHEGHCVAGLEETATPFNPVYSPCAHGSLRHSRYP